MTLLSSHWKCFSCEESGLRWIGYDTTLKRVKRSNTDAVSLRWIGYDTTLKQRRLRPVRLLRLRWIGYDTTLKRA